jgi:predicted amidohydrolase YtcJ
LEIICLAKVADHHTRLGKVHAMEQAQNSHMTVFSNGTVLTLDGTAQPAVALIVRDGRVLASGTATDMRRLAGATAEYVDLHGSTLMPGLIDTHPHLMHFSALAYPLVDIADATSHEDIVARIRVRAGETPPGEWIMTTPVGEPHYFIRRSYRDLLEQELPRRHILDRATTDHPVMIQAWAPVTPNVCALNSAGLARLGITRDTPDHIDNVWIEKDATDEPTGILRGSVNNYYNNCPFWDELLLTLPLLQPAAVLAGTRQAMRTYNALGVTTVYEGHLMGARDLEAYQTLRDEGVLSLRVLVALEAEPYGLAWTKSLSREQFQAHLKRALAAVELADHFLRVKGVTFTRGGPCWPGFMRMRKPYKGPYGEFTTGVSFVSSEKAELAMRFCAAQGLRLNIIAVGDQEHDEYLGQLEAVAADYDIRGRHWILQHAFFVEPEHARRYAALGFDITTSMSFCWGKGDLFVERVGEQVLEHLIPLRRLLDAGLTVACGSDWGPKNIFEHIELAMTHRFGGSGRTNLGPAQQITRDEALAMWTRAAAQVLGWEGIGTLAPGNHADMIIVDRDPLTCPLDELPGTRVLRTILGGTTVYDAGVL